MWNRCISPQKDRNSISLPFYGFIESNDLMEPINTQGHNVFTDSHVDILRHAYTQYTAPTLSHKHKSTLTNSFHKGFFTNYFQRNLLTARLSAPHEASSPFRHSNQQNLIATYWPSGGMPGAIECGRCTSEVTNTRSEIIHHLSS